MMIRMIRLLFIFFILKTIHADDRAFRTDKSNCSIYRQGFGQFQHVQITSSSIYIQFQNPFSNFQCPSISIYASITNTQTNKLEQIIENIQSNILNIRQLLSNQNYSITLKISDGNNIRSLPSYIYQTLSSSKENTLTFSNSELLSIEQIESVLFPYTHLYLVTLTFPQQRSKIFANLTLSYKRNNKQYQSHHSVKPLDNQIISSIGRQIKKTIAFSIELPMNISEYTSTIQLFFLDNSHQSILDYPILIQNSLPITVEILPMSTRSQRVILRHLCLSYIEIKAIVYQNSKIIFRNQCDITKIDTSLLDINNGQCTMIFDKLQPEENYTLSIRSTCPISISPSSSFVYYDHPRNFTIQTSADLPDGIPLIYSYFNENRTLIWTNPKGFYLGPDYSYELLTKSNENWTVIYRGKENFYRLDSTLIQQTNLTFRIYIQNRFGRQENYTQIHIHIDPIHHINSTNPYLLSTIIISTLFLILFGFLFLGCYLRNKKLYGKLKNKYIQNGTISDKELEHLRSINYTNTLKDNILYTWNHTPTNVDLNKLPKIERNSIKLDRLIGKGAFGEVYAGKFTQQSVAIKTLLSSANPSQRLDFLKEAIIMNQFHHPHIIHLLGVCFHQDFQAQYLVLELMEQGDLQNYLRRSRPTSTNSQCQLSYENCLDIAQQIADGACYLEQHSYVHRDLAARNCLVTLKDKLQVKIGDFGLARMLSQQDYYRKTGEALLPVRWMAPESLLDAIFTSQSDVWSFGIVLWEIITLGQVPYSPLNNQQVISLITTTKGTLEKPVQCTESLYILMLTCWIYVPENRISFLEIYTRLNEIIADENKEQPDVWFSNEITSSTARNVLDNVLSHIEPPTSISFEGSDIGECRSSTSGCFSSMTESTSQIHHQQHSNNLNQPLSNYHLRLIDDTTSNDYDDDHSDIIARSTY